MRPVAFSGICKIIFTDMDCTFLTTDKHLLQENLDAIAEAQNAGIYVSIASGRYWRAVEPWSRQMGLITPQVLDNGASIISPKDGRVLYSESLGEEAARNVYFKMRNSELFPVVCTSKEYYMAYTNDETDRGLAFHNEAYTRISEEELLARMPDVVKIGAYDNQRADLLSRFSVEWRQEWDTLGYHCHPIITEYGILVVTSSRASKLTGIKQVCAMLGCGLEDVATIGDGDNDAEMLGGVGMSIAVANATELAKANAVRVTGKNNDEAGFAEAVRMLLK